MLTPEDSESSEGVISASAMHTLSFFPKIALKES